MPPDSPTGEIRKIPFITGFLDDFLDFWLPQLRHAMEILIKTEWNPYYNRTNRAYCSYEQSRLRCGGQLGPNTTAETNARTGRLRRNRL